MFPAATNARGKARTPHDVCQRQSAESPEADAETTAEPCTNLGDNRLINPVTAGRRVRIQNMLPANTSTRTLSSEGNEAFDAGGVVSRMTRGASKINVGSSRVIMEGAPAAFLGSTVAQNGIANANAPFGRQDEPSQSLVYVSP